MIHHNIKLIVTRGKKTPKLDIKKDDFFKGESEIIFITIRFMLEESSSLLFKTRLLHGYLYIPKRNIFLLQ